MHSGMLRVYRSVVMGIDVNMCVFLEVKTLKTGVGMTVWAIFANMWMNEYIGEYISVRVYVYG